MLSIKQMYLQGPNAYFKISIAFLVLICVSLVCSLVLWSAGDFAYSDSQKYYALADNLMTYVVFFLAVLAFIFMSIGAIKLMLSWRKKKATS